MKVQVICMLGGQCLVYPRIHLSLLFCHQCLYHKVRTLLTNLIEACLPHLSSGLDMVAEFGFSSIIYHAQFLLKTLPTDHRIFATPLFHDQDVFSIYPDWFVLASQQIASKLLEFLHMFQLLCQVWFLCVSLLYNDGPVFEIHCWHSIVHYGHYCCLCLCLINLPAWCCLTSSSNHKSVAWCM